MRTRAKWKFVAKATALGARVPQGNSLFLQKNKRAGCQLDLRDMHCSLKRFDYNICFLDLQVKIRGMICKVTGAERLYFVIGIPFVMRRMIFQITTMGIPSVMTTVVRSPVHPPIITSSIIPIFPISILDHSFAFSTMYNPYFNSWARQRKEISRFFSKILTILLLHAVSYAYFCKDVFRLRRIFFDFSANISHIYPEDLVVLISVWSPHIMEKSGVGNDLA